MLLSAPIQEITRQTLPWQEELMCTLQQRLQRLHSVQLVDMDRSRLMKRMDTKYLFPASLLPEILAGLEERYDVLEVGGVRMQRYRTCYFDTPDFKLYHQHHNDQRDRYKLRVRSYLETAVDYLEVKRKDNHDRTCKSRLRTEDVNPLDSSHLLDLCGANSFLQQTFPLSTAHLVPKISNRFYRIALVSRWERERLTIDLDLRFMTPGFQFGLPGLAVAEVKQPHFSTRSAFVRQMRQAGRRPMGFSKYCVGVALAYPHLKRNAFKPLLLELRKLVLGGAL